MFTLFSNDLPHILRTAGASIDRSDQTLILAILNRICNRRDWTFCKAKSVALLTDDRKTLNKIFDRLTLLCKVFPGVEQNAEGVLKTQTFCFKDLQIEYQLDDKNSTQATLYVKDLANNSKQWVKILEELHEKFHKQNQGNKNQKHLDAKKDQEITIRFFAKHDGKRCFFEEEFELQKLQQLIKKQMILGFNTFEKVYVVPSSLIALSLANQKLDQTIIVDHPALRLWQDDPQFQQIVFKKFEQAFHKRLALTWYETKKEDIPICYTVVGESQKSLLKQSLDELNIKLLQEPQYDSYSERYIFILRSDEVMATAMLWENVPVLEKTPSTKKAQPEQNTATNNSTLACTP